MFDPLFWVSNQATRIDLTSVLLCNLACSISWAMDGDLFLNWICILIVYTYIQLIIKAPPAYISPYGDRWMRSVKKQQRTEKKYPKTNSMLIFLVTFYSMSVRKTTRYPLRDNIYVVTPICLSKLVEVFKIVFVIVQSKKVSIRNLH